jgi:3-methyl-2-oxobutanoate hydroxymethyltransferase
MNVHDFAAAKKSGRKLSMVTCYDAWSAKIIAESLVDCILVGDSVSMVVHGYPSTVSATDEMMAFHTRAVATGVAGKKFIVGDMPFLSYRKGVLEALRSVDGLMKAGASAVKLEGVWGHEDVVEQIVRSGVPVMGHIGLTPQSIFGLGGFKVQGRAEKDAADLVAQAKKLEELGAFSVVLECVPSALGARITAEIGIPTIGIGAGASTDGQVLVLQDLLGMSKDFKPKFLRHFADGYGLIEKALADFHGQVSTGEFPGPEETYR